MKRVFLTSPSKPYAPKTECDTYMSPDMREQIGWFIEGLAALLLGAAIFSECHTVNQEISYALRGGAAINRRIFNGRCTHQNIFLGVPQGTS